MPHDPYEALKRLLVALQAADRDYDKRYGLVLDAVAEAHRVGVLAGFRCDTDEQEWPFAFIELPSGQVSWHLPQHPRPWDGHSTEEKYARIDHFLRSGETAA